MLVPFILPLLSMRKINSPRVFLRFGWTDWRSGQKLSMMTEWWGMSLWRRFRMISVWRRKENSHLSIQGAQSYSWGLTLVAPNTLQVWSDFYSSSVYKTSRFLAPLLDVHRLQWQQGLWRQKTWVWISAITVQWCWVSPSSGSVASLENGTNKAHFSRWFWGWTGLACRWEGPDMRVGPQLSCGFFPFHMQGWATLGLTLAVNWASLVYRFSPTDKLPTHASSFTSLEILPPSYMDLIT